MSLFRVLLFLIAFYCIINCPGDASEQSKFRRFESIGGSLPSGKTKKQESENAPKKPPRKVYNEKGNLDITISFDGEVTRQISERDIENFLCFEAKNVDTKDSRFHVAEIKFSDNEKHTSIDSTLIKTTFSNCLTPYMLTLVHRVEREYVLTASVRSVTTPMNNYPKFDFVKKSKRDDKACSVKVTNYKSHMTTEREIQLEDKVEILDAPDMRTILSLKKTEKKSFLKKGNVFVKLASLVLRE